MESDKNTQQPTEEEKTVEENAVVDKVNEEEYDEEDYSDGEVIDINNDDYVVMDVDDFLERAEDALNDEGEEEEEPEEEEEEVIQRDSIYSFEKHTDSVLCCAINPANHEQILTGGQDNHAYLFTYTKPDQVQELTGHNVDCVCFSLSHRKVYVL